MNFQTNFCYREKEKKLAVATLLGGGSLLIVGKAGSRRFGADRIRLP